MEAALAFRGQAEGLGSETSKDESWKLKSQERQAKSSEEEMEGSGVTWQRGLKTKSVMTSLRAASVELPGQARLQGARE